MRIGEELEDARAAVVPEPEHVRGAAAGHGDDVDQDQAAAVGFDADQLGEIACREQTGEFPVEFRNDLRDVAGDQLRVFLLVGIELEPGFRD